MRWTANRCSRHPRSLLKSHSYRLRDRRGLPVACPEALSVGVLEKTTVLPDSVTALTVTEIGLPLGDAMPETETVKVASVPLAAKSAVEGPESVIDVGPAGTMSSKVTAPMLGAARNESTSVYVAPGVLERSG